MNDILATLARTMVYRRDEINSPSYQSDLSLVKSIISQLDSEVEEDDIVFENEVDGIVASVKCSYITHYNHASPLRFTKRGINERILACCAAAITCVVEKAMEEKPTIDFSSSIKKIAKKISSKNSSIADFLLNDIEPTIREISDLKRRFDKLHSTFLKQGVEKALIQPEFKECSMSLFLQPFDNDTPRICLDSVMDSRSKTIFDIEEEEVVVAQLGDSDQTIYDRLGLIYGWALPTPNYTDSLAAESVFLGNEMSEKKKKEKKRI